MLLPIEFLFPRGFFAADILVVFPLTCFWAEFFEFLKNFGCNVLERYLGILCVKLCTCRLLIELLEIVTERKYFMDWLLFLDLTLTITGIWFLWIKNFAQDFVSGLLQSKACHLESIYGTNQICTWELRLNTLEASCREFVSSIKDFVSGFYWLVNQEPSLGTVFVKY